MQSDANLSASAVTNLGRQFGEHLPHRLDRAPATIGTREPGHHCVPDELVDVAALLRDDLSLHAQHLIEPLNDAFGISAFGERGEVTDVREQNNHPLALGNEGHTGVTMPQRKWMVVLFSDIRDFTAFSEG